MKYTAKLAHYAFDNTYTNARLFDTKTARDTYFDTLAGYTQSELVNFNARDILSTDIIIKVEPNAPLFDLLNYNYCIIIGYDDDEEEQERLHFFVKRSVQESGGQIRVYLENDIIQNYWYDIDFAECMINRAHLNRFEEVSPGSSDVKFRGNANSDLFEREDIKDVAKRLIKREKLMPIIDEEDDGLNSFNYFIQDNVIAWCYVMVSSRNTAEGHEGDILTYKDVNDASITATPTYLGTDAYGIVDEQIVYPYMTFCFPIMKQGKSIIFDNLAGGTGYHNVGWDFEGLVGFLNKNKGYAYVHTIKLSAKPPFIPDDFTLYTGASYSVSTNSLKISNNSGQYAYGKKWEVFIDTGTNDYHAMLIYDYDYTKPVEFIVRDSDSVLPSFEFLKTSIIGQNKNIKFNPKINNADYKTLAISYCGSSYEYDLQKLDDNRPHFNFFEMITADVTKAIMTFKSANNNGVYNDQYAKSYNGLIVNTDLSIPIANSQYDTYLANNKNAYLSFSNTQKLAAYQGILNTLSNFVGLAGTLSGFGGNVTGAGTTAGRGIISTAMQLKYNQAQFTLTMDNMKNAPDTLSNANGNAILNQTIADIMPYFELYSALDNELKIANDIAYDNGYICNKYGKVKDYVNTRKYFNYISATITNVIGNVSNEVKNLYREILAKGIKLWHTDTINFDKENYELWLEE